MQQLPYMLLRFICKIFKCIWVPNTKRFFPFQNDLLQHEYEFFLILCLLESLSHRERRGLCIAEYRNKPPHWRCPAQSLVPLRRSIRPRTNRVDVLTTPFLFQEEESRHYVAPTAYALAPHPSPSYPSPILPGAFPSH